MINYFKLLISLKYYLLGINKDTGVLIHISFKSAIRTITIDNLFSHEECREIISKFMATKEAQIKYILSKEETILCSIPSLFTAKPLLLSTKQ